MNKFFCFGMSCLVFSLVLACTSTTTTTATAPFIYTNNENVDFEILGEILHESSERVGYIELLKAARNLYPDCDYVIDIMADQRVTTTTTTTNFFIRSSQSVDTSIVWIMRGTVIKYRR